MMRKMITEWDEYVFIFICVFILRFFLFAKSMTDFFLFGLFSYSFYVYFGENWRMRVWFDPVSFTMNHNTHTQYKYASKSNSAAVKENRIQTNENIQGRDTFF